MEKLLEYFMKIRNSKPTDIDKAFKEYTDVLKTKFPNDTELGTYIRNN